MADKKNAKRPEPEVDNPVHAKLVAKKDFSIHHNEYHREIKAGDDVSDVPEAYHQNLRTEGVL